MIGRLPIFVVAGMPRGGTTFLFHNLGKHPDVFLPFRKEVNYFNVRHEKGVDWYHSLYKDRTTERVCGDISPPCFLDPRSIDRITDYSADTRIILSIRDPLDYALSFYGQFSSFRFNMPPLADFLQGFDYKIGKGQLRVRFEDDYVIDTIRRFANRFGANLLMYDFRYFQTNRLEVLQSLERFLGIDPFFATGNFDDLKINAAQRKGSKAVNSLLANENVIGTVQKLLPRKTIVFLRTLFDKAGARGLPSGQEEDKGARMLFSEPERELARKMLQPQRDAVQELFARGSIVDGTGQTCGTGESGGRLRAGVNPDS